MLEAQQPALVTAQAQVGGARGQPDPARGRDLPGLGDLDVQPRGLGELLGEERDEVLGQVLDHDHGHGERPGKAVSSCCEHHRAARRRGDQQDLGLDPLAGRRREMKGGRRGHGGRRGEGGHGSLPQGLDPPAELLAHVVEALLDAVHALGLEQVVPGPERQGLPRSARRRAGCGC
ncbi:hypothetical protein [Pseudenhygromyxa sp. WMMC2535]|uniref:hypothetical protein n=1 Tax=Pseudenhygromyxa sp. WMMC2535 TaxID=2712867 RepID=UPI0020CFF283|nr:hypothetical protein [Pseudenhygromyxa sp. WMMC2535]